MVRVICLVLMYLYCTRHYTNIVFVHNIRKCNSAAIVFHKHGIHVVL